MIKVNNNSFKEEVIRILSAAFDDNKSVNYVVKQGPKRKKRVKKLIEYSYNVCIKYGEVYLSEDTNAAVLLLRSDKKKFTPMLDLRLAISVITLPRVFKVMDREAKIKNRSPKEPYLYLWFIGVDPEYQRSGIGTKLLTEVLKYSEKQGLPVCLETSALSNVPWYEKHKFKIYDSIEDFGFKLAMMIRG